MWISIPFTWENLHENFPYLEVKEEPFLITWLTMMIRDAEEAVEDKRIKPLFAVVGKFQLF